MKQIKIAYIGGGSRGWAWGLMSDLVKADDICGDVALYDIDFKAAKDNEIIGNKFNNAEGANSVWNYKAYDNIGDALTGADFVVISILPGTFDEMESDVHYPEKYGIYQSVGDTSGPGGIVRALRTIPMFEEIALAVKEYCPKAWVINYTNPMTICVSTLYKAFPEIKAFGCCHEVFGTQDVLIRMLKEEKGITDVARTDIKVNVTGVNHFTWLTSAQYGDMDLMPLYKEYCEKNIKDGLPNTEKENDHWMNGGFRCLHKVKMDLFLRYGLIAAAGDRHLAEFCDKEWYIDNPDLVRDWGFGLTSVAWRKNHLQDRLDKSARLVSGEEEVKIAVTGEEGVEQIRALLGLRDLVTNVNIPNVGQIPNLPLGAVVETNASFRTNELRPVMAGNVPDEIYTLISRIVGEQLLIVEAGMERDIEKAFKAFVADPLVNLPLDKARELFEAMLNNTKKYLGGYEL